MIKINKTDTNLLLIHYPSGGYGYYLARLINSFVTNVVKTADNFLFDDLGTSHSLPLVAGNIHFGQNIDSMYADPMYRNDIDQNKYIVVPHCPGIGNDSTLGFIHSFQNAKIIHLCYKDNTWPLVFQNCIVKARQGNVETDVDFDKNLFGSDDNWARRENFVLTFINHYYRKMWKECWHDRVLNIDISDLLTTPDRVLAQISDFINGTLTQIDLLPAGHQQFLNTNPNTVTHLEILKIVDCLETEQDLQHIKQLYHQALVNFYLQLKFDFVVPANDYSEWFTNTNEIVEMLNKHGVSIDSN